MSDFETSLLSVKEALFDNNIIKSFLELNEQIKKDETIQNLLKSQKDAQHKMCKFVDNDEQYLKYKNDFINCSKQLESNPLYANFMNVKEEAFSLLEEVKEALE